MNVTDAERLKSAIEEVLSADGTDVRHDGNPSVAWQHGFVDGFEFAREWLRSLAFPPRLVPPDEPSVKGAQ